MRTLTIFVLGMLAGWMIAPDKGSNTRNSLRKFMDRFTGDEDGGGLVNTSITSDKVLHTDQYPSMG
jgi:hypothetical protein